MSSTENRWDVKREAKIIANLRFGSIKNMILRGAIKEDDLIWHDGLSGWRKAGDQEELKSFFSTSGGSACGGTPGGKENKKTDKELTRRKILVVDDEPDMVDLMKEALKDEGYQALSAANGADGIRLNKRENPDLIILDLRMPEMDGIETLRQIRKKDDKVRVVILTGYGSPETIRDAADLDVSEYLSKPFDNEQLLRVISEALGRPMGSRNDK